MSKTMRIYRLIDSVMMYSKNEGNKDLSYDSVKEAVIVYCNKHPRLSFKTHVGDDHAARQIASNLTGVKIW